MRTTLVFTVPDIDGRSKAPCRFVHPAVTDSERDRHGVCSPADAVACARRSRSAGRTVVFTNGVFDLLHPGHVRYLRQARALGDLLIVGINSDRSVRSNRGPQRPITPERERAEIVAALSCVNVVVVFDDETPHNLIAAVQPNVLVKGADWPANEIVGRDIVEARGGQVIRMPVEAGHSTTSIIERIRSRFGNSQRNSGSR